MIFQIINNPGLGLCHILKKNNYGYLIYSENNTQHFIITSKITEDNSFYFTRYINDIDTALKIFNELGDDLNE